MAIHVGKPEPHWNYFLAIERDLETLARYVEFDKQNFECYSIEIARLLLATAAEVDIVCKQLCRKINSKSTAGNIIKYRSEITKQFPRFSTFIVQLPRFELRLNPWEPWGKKGSDPPLWWTAYNKTKHERATEFPRANLKNTLNAIAGLYVALLHLYKEKAELAELTPNPILLRPDTSYFRGISYQSFEEGYSYDLS